MSLLWSAGPIPLGNLLKAKLLSLYISLFIFLSLSLLLVVTLSFSVSLRLPLSVSLSRFLTIPRHLKVDEEMIQMKMT